MDTKEKPKILIVDDERTQRKALCDIVGDHGYGTITADGGRDALKKVEEDAFALALIDIRLGDISGLEVLKRIKRVKPDVECILITAHASQESAIEALNLGAYSYLQKPLDAERLLISVERALEKRAAERELGGLKAFHEGIVQNMSDGIAVGDEEGHFTFLNPAACDMIGYSEEELLGEHWTTVIPSDQEEIVREANRRREEGVSNRYEVEVEHKDGSRRRLLVSGSPRFEGGEFEGTLAVFTDITDRERAEKQMRLQSVALESAANAILIIDREGTIQWVNPAFTELTGYSGEEAVGRNLSILRSRRQDPDLYAELWRTISAGRPWRGRLIHRKKTGEHYVEEQTITPVRDDQGAVTHYIAIKRDVTDWVKAEHTLKQQVERLKVLNALAVSGTKAKSENELISNAVEILADTLYPDLVEVLLVDEGRDALVTHPSSLGLEVSDDLLTIPVGEGIVGGVAQSGQPKRVRDVTQDPTYIEVNPRIRSELCVPIMMGERVLGVINVENEEVNAFDQADQRLLTTFAGQLATAIERARLLEATRQRAKELSALYQSTLTVTRELEPEGMLAQLSERVDDVFTPDVFLVSVLMPESGEINIALALEEGKRLTEVEGLRLSLDEKKGLMSWMMRNQTSLLVRDMKKETLPVEPHQSGKIPRSWLGVPMVVGDQLVGALSVQSFEARAFDEDDQQLLELFANQAAVALENARLFSATEKQVAQMSLVNEVARKAILSLDPDDLFWEAAKFINQEFEHPAVSLFLVDRDKNCLVRKAWAGLYKHDARKPIKGEGVVDWVVIHGKSALLKDVSQDDRYKEIFPETKSEMCVPMIEGGEVVGGINIESDQVNAFDDTDVLAMETLADTLVAGLRTARLFNEVQDRVRELEAVAAVSSVLGKAKDREEMAPIIVGEAAVALRTEHGGIAVGYPDQDTLGIDYGQGIWREIAGERHASDIGLSGHVMTTGEPYVSEDARGDPILAYPELLQEVRAVACVPLSVRDQVIGAIWMGRLEPFLEKEVDILAAIADIAANAIHRATLYEQTQIQVERLKAMRDIDRTISSSLDMNLTLNILLKEVETQLQVDAADVLLYDSGLQQLEYAAESGFETASVEGVTLRLGEGFGGRAVSQRELVHIPDLSQLNKNKKQPLSFVEDEGFRGYAAMPLIAKGDIKGVLEVYQRSPLDPGPDWFDFFETLSTQAAVAIDHMRLFEDLQRSNVELTQSYEKTLEGWARALELRDQETQGHSDRVTNLTLQLAKKLGVEKSEWRYLRWGALLHDIGKMSIPDRILLKPGKLTQDEWERMKKHPSLAYEMLSSIDHLRPALDIPRYHHERWDGSGYPEGLQGEEIPLAARIFAVADVWDALRSDRPYRDAWTDEDALEHIQEQSGKHFDPHVVDAFMSIIKEN